MFEKVGLIIGESSGGGNVGVGSYGQIVFETKMAQKPVINAPQSALVTTFPLLVPSIFPELNLNPFATIRIG